LKSPLRDSQRLDVTFFRQLPPLGATIFSLLYTCQGEFSYTS
jgi:hypothetical protein